MKHGKDKIVQVLILVMLGVILIANFTTFQIILDIQDTFSDTGAEVL